jgi:hypothetical protein
VAAAPHEPYKTAPAVKQDVLIDYDGSSDAGSAIDAAAALLGPRHAVVPNGAPVTT